ncbi:hypothetical protein LCGC14_2202520 [marine sediment metagenome]|uniref:Uncharacterized protein n=1 Tax=marine sediment metagenome TaxID=412755 RepID=A0A0F9FTL9_9ZZZZ
MGLHAARDLLEHLTDRFPPPEGRNHSLMVRGDGESGLDLILQIGEKWQSFPLDEEDMNVPPAELGGTIAKLMPTD